MTEEQTEPRRVLVAEDEGLIRLDIVETLTSAGFDVVGEAADGSSMVPPGPGVPPISLGQ